MSDDLLRKVAMKARELVEGMRLRVNRDPDIADYIAGFEPIFASRTPQIIMFDEDGWLAAHDAALISATLACAADQCDRHAKFCKDEAQKGGDFTYLMARESEALHNAGRIRAITPDAVAAWQDKSKKTIGGDAT